MDWTQLSEFLHLSASTIPSLLSRCHATIRNSRLMDKHCIVSTGKAVDNWQHLPNSQSKNISEVTSHMSKLSKDVNNYLKNTSKYPSNMCWYPYSALTYGWLPQRYSCFASIVCCAEDGFAVTFEQMQCCTRHVNWTQKAMLPTLAVRHTQRLLHVGNNVHWSQPKQTHKFCHSVCPLH